MSKKTRRINQEEEQEWLDALELIDKLVYRAKGKGLSEAQKLVLRCAWDQKEYKEISDGKYASAYLTGTVAHGLWESLSLIFSQRLRKKDIRSFFANASVANHRHMFDEPKIIGATLPDTSKFYGRKEELIELENGVIQKKLTILTGETGIGKSLLAAKLVEDIGKEKNSKFDVLIWKPIVYSISAEELVNTILKTLKLQTDFEKFYFKLDYLINQLRKQRCLIVLDGFENILSQPKYKEEYIKFFRRFIEEGYDTSFLITSRISFQGASIFSNTKLIKEMQIGGLDNTAAIKILEDKGIKQPEEAKGLIESYQGNPASLKELGEKIKNYFGGNIQQYLKYQTTMIEERLQTMLHQYFGQPDSLNSLQRSIMIYIAENLTAKNNNDKETQHKSDNFIKITSILDFFKEKLGDKVSNGELFSALKELEIKLLIQPHEDDNYEICYTLQPGVKKYIINDPLGLVRNNPNFQILGV